MRRNRASSCRAWGAWRFGRRSPPSSLAAMTHPPCSSPGSSILTKNHTTCPCVCIYIILTNSQLLLLSFWAPRPLSSFSSLMSGFPFGVPESAWWPYPLARNGSSWSSAQWPCAHGHAWSDHCFAAWTACLKGVSWHWERPTRILKEHK